MKKYLKIGLTSLVLISLSNIAHSETLKIKREGEWVRPDLCLKALSEGNTLHSEKNSLGMNLMIVYKTHLYPVEIRWAQSEVFCTSRQLLTYN